MNFEMFGEGRPGARQALMEQQRVLMNEAQRDKLRETSGLRLNCAQEQELIHPMFGRLHVTIHQCGSRANAQSVSGSDHFAPLAGGELVARENFPNLVVE